jgi:hypothetical protein
MKHLALVSLLTALSSPFAAAAPHVASCSWFFMHQGAQGEGNLQVALKEGAGNQYTELEVELLHDYVATLYVSQQDGEFSETAVVLFRRWHDANGAVRYWELFPGRIGTNTEAFYAELPHLNFRKSTPYYLDGFFSNSNLPKEILFLHVYCLDRHEAR